MLNNGLQKWPLVRRFAFSLLKDLWGKTHIKYLKTPFMFLDSLTLLKRDGLEARQCQPTLFMVANINSLRPWHRARTEGPFPPPPLLDKEGPPFSLSSALGMTSIASHPTTATASIHTQLIFLVHLPCARYWLRHFSTIYLYFCNISGHHSSI